MGNFALSQGPVWKKTAAMLPELSASTARNCRRPRPKLSSARLHLGDDRAALAVDELGDLLEGAAIFVDAREQEEHVARALQPLLVEEADQARVEAPADLLERRRQRAGAGRDAQHPRGGLFFLGGRGLLLPALLRRWRSNRDCLPLPPGERVGERACAGGALTGPLDSARGERREASGFAGGAVTGPLHSARGERRGLSGSTARPSSRSTCTTRAIAAFRAATSDESMLVSSACSAATRCGDNDSRDRVSAAASVSPQILDRAQVGEVARTGEAQRARPGTRAGAG